MISGNTGPVNRPILRKAKHYLLCPLILLQACFIVLWYATQRPNLQQCLVVCIVFIVVWVLPLFVFVVAKRICSNFRLSTLLLIVFFWSCLLSGWATLDRADRAQRRAMARIEELGGTYTTRYTGPHWLRRVLHDACFPKCYTVTAVELDLTSVSDRDLELLCESLDQLTFFGINSANVTNRGLQVLSNAGNLEWLILARIRITDDGLTCLRRLTRLKYVDLSNNLLTDAGMVHIAAIKSLRHLNLRGTSISDSSIDQLVTLPHLDDIDLRGTQVSADGAARLRRAFPDALVQGPFPPPCTSLPAPAKYGANTWEQGEHLEHSLLLGLLLGVRD